MALRPAGAPHLSLQFDMRAPDFGASPVDLYRAAVEMSTWADGLGFESVTLNEHHNTIDGYLPSPMVLAAAIAARTSHVELEIAALVVTLHHPLRVAEDLAVLDVLAEGRLKVLLGAGYRREEFLAFGIDWKKRPSMIEETVATLRQAWTGEPFEFRGVPVQVLPRPVRPDGPPLALAGASEPSARRAARLGLAYQPISQHLLDVYLEELDRLGVPVPDDACVDPFLDTLSPSGVRAPQFLHVAEDPDAAWATIAPHALHHTNTYAIWAQSKDLTPFKALDDADELRANGTHQVLDVAGAVDLLRALGPDGRLRLMPLLGGLDPEIAWSSLRLLEEAVLPQLAGLRGPVAAPEAGRASSADPRIADRIADEVFRAFETGDVEVIRRRVAHGARFRNPFHLRTREDVLALMTPGQPLQPGLRYTQPARRLFADGSGFVQEHLALVDGPNGTLELEACVVGRVEGELLTALDMYYDSAPVVRSGLEPAAER